MIGGENPAIYKKKEQACNSGNTYLFAALGLDTKTPGLLLARYK